MRLGHSFGLVGAPALDVLRERLPLTTPFPSPLLNIWSHPPPPIDFSTARLAGNFPDAPSWMLAWIKRSGTAGLTKRPLTQEGASIIGPNQRWRPLAGRIISLSGE